MLRYFCRCYAEKQTEPQTPQNKETNKQQTKVALSAIEIQIAKDIAEHKRLVFLTENL